MVTPTSDRFSHMHILPPSLLSDLSRLTRRTTTAPPLAQVSLRDSPMPGWENTLAQRRCSTFQSGSQLAHVNFSHSSLFLSTEPTIHLSRGSHPRL